MKEYEYETNIDGTLKRGGSTRHLQKPGEKRLRELETERELEREKREREAFEKAHPREAARIRKKTEKLEKLKREEAARREKNGGGEDEPDKELNFWEEEKQELEEREMTEKSAKNKKTGSDARRSGPRKAAKTSSRKLSVFTNLPAKRTAKREAEQKRKAEDEAKLPKEPVKRFFAKLHPKRVAKAVFSKHGLFVFLKICAALLLIGIILTGGLFLYYKKDLDSIRLDQMTVSETVNKYLDRNGNLLWEDKGDGDYRLVVNGDDIATTMRQATVAIEDRNFYNHPGVDFTALIRATLSTLSGHGVQGGSTLTQQLIKQVYFSDEAKNRTVTGIPRKIKEMILALEVEKMYSKEQIITMYLNESPYGGRRNGVESAAQTYFGKSAKDLTLAESALLASIPNNPAVLNPYNTAANDALIARQQKTLDVMTEMGYITKEEADAAKKEPVLDTLKPETSQYDNILAPHFVLEVKKQLEEKYGVKTMRAGGYTIKTTLDLKAQQYAEQAVQHGVEMFNQNGSDNLALASVDVETGQVIAMVGSSNWNAPVYGQVNAATSLLEPGSTIKPVLDYTPLFMQREGQNYGPGSIIKDENIDRIYCAGYRGSCKIRNYTGAFYGNVTARKALANSLNIPAVKALYINGIENSLKTLHALGDLSYCSEDNSGGLSIAIGSGCNVTPIEHANTYASIARGGVYKPLAYVLEVKNSSGDVLENWTDTEGTRVVDPQVAYMVANILGDANARNLVWGSQARSYGFVVPGVWTGTKTGTTTTAISTQTKDSLIASFSTAVATIVWNGNHDGSALWNSSNNIVRRVVTDYMEPVHKDVYAAEGRWKSGDEPVRPAGIQTLKVNGTTDIWPSWYNKKTSGAENVELEFNKYNKKLAAECTPAEFREKVTATKMKDAVSGTEIWTVPEGYDRENKDTCDTLPIVTIDSVSGGVVKFTVSRMSGSGTAHITFDNRKPVTKDDVVSGTDTYEIPAGTKKVSIRVENSNKYTSETATAEIKTTEPEDEE